jgi:hypothetical protein
LKKQIFIALLLLFPARVAAQPIPGTTNNISQWKGNTVDTNSGNKSAGTLRVVLATDQPTMTNAQPITGTVGVTGPVSATQGTSPWVTSGTSTISGTVAVTQSTSPWVVSGTVTGGIPTASSAATQTIINVNDTSTSVLASNSSRKGGWVKNISVSNIFVSFSGTASVSAPTLVEPGNTLSLGQSGTVIYTGAVTAIHGVAGQQRSLEVVEF